MDLQKLTIGQMAELNRISEQTLRLYDREGLLKPRYTDEKTGYRYYHIVQSARLDLIHNMKVYGMTLRQIKEVLQNDDAKSLQKLLSEQADKVTKRIEQLLRSRTAIMRAMENYKKYEAMPKNGEIFFEFIPERKIFSYECEMNFFDQDESGYEYMLRQLKNHLVLKNVPLSYFTNIGTIIRKDRLLSGELFSNEVFIFADEWAEKGELETIPASAYICTCSDEFSAEAENVRRLADYALEHNYRIIGDYLCEVIVDFTVMESTSRNTYYKAQIPVRHFGNNIY
ncbi:MAG: MerR family transcriptional regulator [Candidatus Limivicinus sp.]